MIIFLIFITVVKVPNNEEHIITGAVLQGSILGAFFDLTIMLSVRSQLLMKVLVSTPNLENVKNVKKKLVLLCELESDFMVHSLRLFLATESL